MRSEDDWLMKTLQAASERFSHHPEWLQEAHKREAEVRREQALREYNTTDCRLIQDHFRELEVEATVHALGNLLPWNAVSDVYYKDPDWLVLRFLGPSVLDAPLFLCFDDLGVLQCTISAWLNSWVTSSVTATSALALGSTPESPAY